MKCLAFDLGRVLFDFDYTIALNKIEKKVGVSRQEIVDALFKEDFSLDFEKGLLSTEEFYTLFIERFKAQIPLAEFVAVWSDIFALKQQMYELIKRLALVYPTYLISNICQPHYDHLIKAHLEVFALFDGLILSYLVKSVKPEKTIYEALAKSAGVGFGDITYIDDRKELIESAEGFGLCAIQFHTKEQLIPSLEAKGIAVPTESEYQTLLRVKEALSGDETLLVGLGNELKGDDAIGINITRHCAQKITPATLAAPGAVENYLGAITKTRHKRVIIIDCADFQGPERIRLFTPDELRQLSLFSTHDSSLKLSIQYLKTHRFVDILILGIRAVSYALGENVSFASNLTQEMVESFLLKHFSHNQKVQT